MATKYTIHYQYGTYSGTRVIWMEDDEDHWTAIDKMWFQMRKRGEMTLGMAAMSAKVIKQEQVSDEDEE